MPSPSRRSIPWDEIRDMQLKKAEWELKQRPIVPDPEAGCWNVQSSTGDGRVYSIFPKWKRSERQGHPERSNGQWWHLLVCNCEAAATGYMLCWHKAAVYLYWQHCREIRRIEGIAEWGIQDGPQVASPPPVTLVPSTPEVAPEVGLPTHRTRPRGTASKDAKRSGGVARKKPPTTH